MNTYDYSISTWITSGLLNEDVLTKEIHDSSISVALDSMTSSDNNLSIVFQSALSSADETTLDSIVSAHNGDPLAAYKVIIANARAFFDDLLNEFAAENVSMGITVVGKTKEVADYLKDVMYYGQSGSLYEILGVIDTLEAQGYPVELSPFITQTRMDALKARVMEYLGT